LIAVKNESSSKFFNSRTSKAKTAESTFGRGKKQFFEICELLHQNLAGLFSIHHVGSTSIEGMFAKPIIDIDIEILDYNNFNTIYYTISSSTLPIDYIIYLKDYLF